MANAVKQYTFTGGTKAVASEVNANFDDIVSFLNTALVHLDGSKAMTGILTLPAANPTSANQATRKGYVDAQDTAAKAAVKADVLDEVVRWKAGSTALVGAMPASDSLVRVAAGYNAGSTDGAGDLTVNFPANTFTSRVVTVQVTVYFSGTGTGGWNAVWHRHGVRVSAVSLGGFKARLVDTPTGNSRTSGHVEVTWLAIGL